MPRVSVIMPVHNAGQFLGQAIESILQQSWRDFELICIDDGSEDGSVDVLEATRARDPRVRVLRQNHQGIVAALNSAFVAAAGELIARMDSDDVAEPQRFARQVEHLDRHPDIAVLGTAYRIVDEHDRPVKAMPVPLEPEAVAQALTRRNCLAHPTVMMRRAALAGLRGPYRHAFRYAEDYDLWLRVSEGAKLANLPDVLLRYRRRFDAIRFEQIGQQVRSTLAARRLAEMRRAGETDDADTWPEITPERLAALGVGLSEQRREICRAVLAYARQARRAGHRAAARSCLEHADGLAPHGEGVRAWVQHRLRRAKVWL
jgi:glycosyltransferase involved in cell wall biosynthesis